jgi:hypothetical protein
MSNSKNNNHNTNNFFVKVNTWINDILDDTWEIAVDVSTASWHDNNISAHMLSDTEQYVVVRAINSTNHIK